MSELNDMSKEDLEEEACFDGLSARNAALSAAIGCFVLDNTPSHRLDIIVEKSTCEVVRLAASTVLYHRRKKP